MATLFQTNGTKTEVQPENGKNFELEELQRMVGGFIEIAYPSIFNSEYQNHILVINEEGKLNHLENNWEATKIYNNPEDIIVGPALLCFRSQIQ